MRASVRYTIARLLIFFVCMGVGWLAGLRHDPILLVLVAATASMIISLFALNGMRSQFAQDIVERREQRRLQASTRGRDGIVDDEGAEDAEAGLEPDSRPAGSDAEADRRA